MNRRLFTILGLLLVFAMVGMLVWVSNQLDTIRRAPRPVPATVESPSQSQVAPPAASLAPTASMALLEGYGDPDTPPLEDLRKIQHVAVGYFSVVKDAQRFPIGGNADFAAALRGENTNREVFLPAGHRVFSADGLILDRWGTPLIVHPQAWRQLELRSAGPDRIPHNDDDLVLSPTGSSSVGE
ncbi:MAG: hypothetical protein EOP85_05315 [Verrucomicrobiaceae bacterium]|nr:MAG: hypothetical protein EOP85_05315 [Verrucomicrobiaceae bacterium]